MARTLALIAVTVAALAWGAALLAAPLAAPLTASPLAASLSGQGGSGPAPDAVPRGAPEPGAWTRAAALTYAIGALVCHQRPERSFHLAGAQLPVCARCAALYWGAAAGLLGWLLSYPRGARGRGGSRPAPSLPPSAFRRAVLAAAGPVAITAATAASGVWDPSNPWRALLSAPLGVVAGALLAAVLRKDLR